MTLGKAILQNFRVDLIGGVRVPIFQKCPGTSCPASQVSVRGCKVKRLEFRVWGIKQTNRPCVTKKPLSCHQTLVKGDVFS